MVQKAKRPGEKKILRFRGIDRSASKKVYELESALALSQRRLKECSGREESRIETLYKALTPRNRRKLVEYGDLLLGTPKK